MTAAARPAFWALIDIGVNDIAQGTSQVSYEADLAFVIDAIHTAWPSCQVRVAKVWMRGSDAAANTMAGWTDNVLATRVAFAAVGHDERVWMKGADNGAAMTSDGVHYSAAGQAEIVNQWKAVMGF